MNILQTLLTRSVKIISLTFILFFQWNLVWSQIIQRTRRPATLQRAQTVTDTTRTRAVYEKRRMESTGIYNGNVSYASVDTSYSAEPYLQSKSGCEFQKAIDDDGCVIIKYTDGLIKKICGGDITEVITQDGKKHVIRVMKVRAYVMKIPPPPNPSESDNSFNWLSNYNLGLMDDIKKFLKNDKAIQEYLSRESNACNGNMYKEIEYRTIFLEEYLQAK